MGRHGTRFGNESSQKVACITWVFEKDATRATAALSLGTGGHVQWTLPPPPLASSDVATEDVPTYGNRLREVPWHCRNNIA